MVESKPAENEKVVEALEEIRFYLDHGMAPQAMAALAKLQTLAPDHAQFADLRAEVDAANLAALEAEEAPVDVEPVAKNSTPQTFRQSKSSTRLPPSWKKPRQLSTSRRPSKKFLSLPKHPVEPEPAPVVHAPVAQSPRCSGSAN